MNTAAIDAVASSTAPADDDLVLFSPESYWPLNECEEALLESADLAAAAGAYAKLFGLGIHGDGVCGRRLFDPLGYEAVVPLPGQRFEFARLTDDASAHVMAIIIPARDEFGDIVDLAAWRPEDGSLALWRGKVSMLGEDLLAALRLEPEVAIFETVEDWLRAGRRGVFILDHDRARWRLAGEKLCVRSTAFGVRLRSKLKLPEPAIFVAEAA